MKTEARAAMFLLSPALILLTLFFFIPVVGGFVLSLTDYDIYSVGDVANTRVVGGANYATLLHSPLFWRALTNTLYFSLVGELQLRWFAEKITQLPTDTPWQALARNALRDDLSTQQRALTTSVAKMSADSKDPAAMLAAWKERYAGALARLASMTDELKRGGSIDLAVLSVLLRELRSLA